MLSVIRLTRSPRFSPASPGARYTRTAAPLLVESNDHDAQVIGRIAVDGVLEQPSACLLRIRDISDNVHGVLVFAHIPQLCVS